MRRLKGSVAVTERPSPQIVSLSEPPERVSLPARLQLQAALPAPMRAPLQTWCIGYLALLAALEGRLEASARLIGAADARYEVDADQRQVNEQRAHERTLQRLRTAWGDAALQAQIAQGRCLADEDVVLVGLGGAPSPGG